MKTRKPLPGSLKFFSLVCIVGLLYIGLIQADGSHAAAQIHKTPLQLDVPVLKQSTSTSCGEAVIAMAHNYANPDTPITEQEVIDYATAQGYFTRGVPPFTSPANMVKIAENYADNVSAGTVANSNQGLALLIQRLREDEPVIIDVLSNFRDLQSEAHFVVVTGISADPSRDNAFVIHYNDPLTGTKESSDWAGGEGVWNAWQNNGDPGGSGWWMVISPRNRQKILLL
jgi:hypothetical protein